MVRNIYAILILCLAVGFANAQTNILDFEAPATSTVFVNFGGYNGFTSVVANPDPTGNISDSVSMYIKGAGAMTWAGCASNPNPTTLTVTNGGIISLDVYMPAAGDVLLKLEESTTGQPNWELLATNNTPNQWVTLTWDTNTASAAAPNQVASGDYAKVVIFMDFGVMGGASDVTHYFDNLTSTGVAASPVAVDFAVDMNSYTDPYTQVYVSGTLNGWSGDANELTDPDMDGIYTGTIMLLDGFYEFKYTLDNWAVQESFIGGESCTITTAGFTNRALTVAGATTVPTTCWNSCNSCSMPPVTYDVDFSVDMNTYMDTASFTTVYVSGGFNGWSGNANALSDPDNDGIWTGTIPMFDGTYEFKYSVDDWADGESFAGGESCTMTTSGFTNRVFTVSGANLPMANVCWNSCDPCMSSTCADPATGVGALTLDGTRAAIIWDANPDAGFFKIQYRVKGTSGWNPVINVKNQSYQRVAWIINGLTPNTTYQYRMRQQCPDLTAGPYSSVQEFTTFTSSPCDIPAASKIVYMSDPTKVRFYIDYEPGAEKYDVRWRLASGGAITNKIFKFGTTVITGLMSDTDYEYRVRTKCSGVWTGYSSWTQFSTNQAGPAPIAPQTPVAQRGFDNSSTFGLYPNPANSELMVTFEGEDLPVYARVFGSTGSLVREFTLSSTLERLDVSALPIGMYHLQVVFENEDVQTQRFIKN